LFLKKGDTVKVLSGKDKGKSGKVLKALPKKNAAVVEDLNKVKRHSKPSLKAPQGGIIQKELPIPSCKLQVICPACNKPTRVAHKSIDGKNARVCKHCGELLDHA
jgi:large subunit ribosomal protein L24